MTHWRRTRAVWIAATLLAAGCSPPPADPAQTPAAAPAAEVRAEVVVFAAASMVVALDPIAEAYQAETGTVLTISYASSSALAQQIENGAPAEIYVSADPAWADTLEANGYAAQRVDFLGNSLVLVVPAAAGDGVTKPADLTGDTVKHLAIGDPDSVPAGKYAKEALETLGLWEALQPKLVPGMDVRQALLYVERGEAEAGIVYATDAKGSAAVHAVAVLDEHLRAPVKYALVLTALGAQDPNAVDLFEYLQADATAQFEAAGFSRLSPPRESAN